MPGGTNHPQSSDCYYARRRFCYSCFSSVAPIVRIMWIAVAEPTFSLDRFADFFASPAARRSLLTTLRVSAIVTLLATLIGLVIAWELRTTTSR